MIARYRNLLMLSTAALLVAGCGQIYSPYLLLPSEPLHNGEFQAVASLGGLPTVSENYPAVSRGEDLLARYGVSDRVSLQGEVWSGGFPSVRPNGYSVSGIYLLSDRKSPWRFALVPRIAMMTTGNSVAGWGGSLTLATWTPNILGLHPYLGLGALAGAGQRSWSTTSTANGFSIYPNPAYPIGFGGAFNAGLEYDLFDHVTLNAEYSLAGIEILDGAGNYYGNGFWVWGIAAGYRF